MIPRHCNRPAEAGFPIAVISRCVGVLLRVDRVRRSMLELLARLQ